MGNYAAKVAAGIKFLDSKVASGKVPSNWRGKLDTDTLSLESCDVCVLGQLFGDYFEGKEVLDIDNYDTKDYGFNTEYDFDELTRAWKDALGKNGVVVEKGEVYKDVYDAAVKVVQTHIVSISDTETVTAYIVRSGYIKNGEFEDTYPTPNLHVLKKSDFEGSRYSTKVEKFAPKKGMFVQNEAGTVFYMANNNLVREVCDGSTTKWLEDVDTTGLKEVMTAGGEKFSDKLVK